MSEPHLRRFWNIFPQRTMETRHGQTSLGRVSSIKHAGAQLRFDPSTSTATTAIMFTITMAVFAVLVCALSALVLIVCILVCRNKICAGGSFKKKRCPRNRDLDGAESELTCNPPETSGISIEEIEQSFGSSLRAICRGTGISVILFQAFSALWAVPSDQFNSLCKNSVTTQHLVVYSLVSLNYCQVHVVNCISNALEVTLGPSRDA